MVGNNLSALGINAKQLTRQMATSGSLWWMPTTKEFGPQGGLGDWEHHGHVAARFGVSTTRSREDRFGNVATNGPDNTTIRLADSLNLFDLGSLAPRCDGAAGQLSHARVRCRHEVPGVFLQT